MAPPLRRSSHRNLPPMAPEDGKVDQPRRSERLKAQTSNPHPSSGQEADGEADRPRYNLRPRSRPAVSKEGKDHNKGKKPKHEYFLYLDYYREKEKASGRKLNARDSSKQAKWIWNKMNDADKAPYKAEAKRLRAEYKKKKRRMNHSSPEVVSTPPLVNDMAPEVISTPPTVIVMPLQVIVTPPVVNGTPPAVNNSPLQEPNVSDPSWLQDSPAPQQEPVFSFTGSSVDQVSMYVSTGPEVSSHSKFVFKKGKVGGVRPSPPSVNRPAVRPGRK